MKEKQKRKEKRREEKMKVGKRKSALLYLY